QQCEEALQWVSADGLIASGHEAVAALLRASRWWARPAGVIITLPGPRTLAALAYGWVAGHRYMLPGGGAGMFVLRDEPAVGRPMTRPPPPPPGPGRPDHNPFGQGQPGQPPYGQGQPGQPAYGQDPSGYGGGYGQPPQKSGGVP